MARLPAPKSEFMHRALVLAQRGRDAVSPNPMVGAVIVRGGRIVGEGYHRRCGGAHAEANALRAAGSARGADVYVSLEPCAHHGRTPPCAEALARAKVRRVIYAVGDPNPKTRGRGARVLRAAGIAVESGLLREEAAALNRPFFHWIRTGRPWVILKWAMTLDGKTATAGGESQWITGPAARTAAHALRRRADAVVVGTQTALADDPRLDPRPARGRPPVRIILDRRGRLPYRLRLLGPAGERAGDGERVYATTSRVAARRRARLEKNGVEVLVVPERGGLLRLDVLLDRLGERGIAQLLVEGGSELLGECLASGVANEVAAFVAPRLAGGATAPGALAGPGILKLAETPRLESPKVRRLGEDVLITGVIA